MDQYTVISGTNRRGNHTIHFARAYHNLLINRGMNCSLLDLADIAPDFIHMDMYGQASESFQQVLEDFIVKSQKIILVAPEYNGSFPGILKLFIDAISPKYFRQKKFALVGVSTGRAGNLRGIDTLTNILNYMDAQVLPYKLPISRIETLMEGSAITDLQTISVMENQVGRLIEF